MVILRKMKSEDVEAVLALRLKWLAKEFGHTKITDAVQKWFYLYPNNPMAFAYVAETNGNCIGYILCALIAHPAMKGLLGEIDEIYVEDKYQRQGIGKRLVQQAHETFAEYTDDLTVFRARVAHDDEDTQAFWQAMSYEHDTVEYIDYRLE